MRSALLGVVLALLCGCVPRANNYVQTKNNSIPSSYLKALAKEEGISEEDARKMIVESRGKLGAVTVADIQAGRIPGTHGAKEPAAPKRVQLTAR